jgi:hypothetical protein
MTHRNHSTVAAMVLDPAYDFQISGTPPPGMETDGTPRGRAGTHGDIIFSDFPDSLEDIQS